MKFIVFLIVPFIVLQNPVDSNVSPRKMLDSLYYKIPIKALKYDARKAMQLNSVFSSVGDNNEGLGAQMKFNTMLRFKGKEKHSRKGTSGYYDVENDIYYRIKFDDSSHLSYMKTIWFNYEVSELTKCDSQLLDLKNIFKPLSFKSSEIVRYNSKKEKNGEGYSFYSSNLNYLSKKPFLLVYYTFTDISFLGEKSQYTFQIDLYEDNL